MEAVEEMREEGREEDEELVAEAAAVKEEEERGAVGAAGRGAASGSGEATASNGRAPGGRGRKSGPRAAGRRSGRPATPRGRLTPRDLELVRFLGRVKLARAEHVGLRFAMARSKTYARLHLLAAEGLVALERRVPGQAVYYATRTGLAATGLPLGEARMSLATLEHDLAVAEVCARVERTTEAPVVLTEREMRAELRLEGSCAWRTEVRDTGQGRRGSHWPDLTLHRGRGGFMALEVELTQKRADRTRSILAGYARRREGLAAVLYLTPERRQAERLTKMAADVGLEKGLPVFRAHALPGLDVEEVLRELTATIEHQAAERERRRTAAEEHRRAEQEERKRREAEFRARQEELGREEAAAREAQEREERRLSNRLRRTVRGY